MKIQTTKQIIDNLHLSTYKLIEEIFVSIKKKAKASLTQFHFDEGNELFNLPNSHQSLNSLNIGIKNILTKREEVKQLKVKELELSEVLRRAKNKHLVQNINNCLINEVKHFQDRVYDIVDKNLFLGSKTEIDIYSVRNLYNMTQNLSMNSLAYNYNHIQKVNIDLKDCIVYDKTIEFYFKHFDSFTRLPNMKSVSLDMSHTNMNTKVCNLLCGHLGKSLKKMENMREFSLFLQNNLLDKGASCSIANLLESLVEIPTQKEQIIGLSYNSLGTSGIQHISDSLQNLRPKSSMNVKFFLRDNHSDSLALRTLDNASKKVNKLLNGFNLVIVHDDIKQDEYSPTKEPIYTPKSMIFNRSRSIQNLDYQDLDKNAHNKHYSNKISM